MKRVWDLEWFEFYRLKKTNRQKYNKHYQFSLCGVNNYAHRKLTLSNILKLRDVCNEIIEQEED